MSANNPLQTTFRPSRTCPSNPPGYSPCITSSVGLPTAPQPETLTSSTHSHSSPNHARELALDAGQRPHR
ncbi:hypothetical protein DL93DRAFT_2091000, partial [Clavulina sp. PMI_390]